MGTFVGLDVSLKETSVCILDQDGMNRSSGINDARFERRTNGAARG